ncbi:MAG TPA: ribbon-helix-helix protein, CopG family [Candidatus Limnocylindria bacterium]|nr:ribbon-helix-helix protein, CopG family [Candidatus Limnocylindria bacterium]
MPAKRVLISIDDRLLERIDAACERLGMSRSAYLAQSASRDLEGGTGPGASPAVRSALATLDRILGERR